MTDDTHTTTARQTTPPLERRRRPRVAGVAHVRRRDGAGRGGHRPAWRAVRRARRSAPIEPRPVTPPTATAADAVHPRAQRLAATAGRGARRVRATRSCRPNSYDEQAPGAGQRVEALEARGRPLLARLVDWVAALGVRRAGGGQRRGRRAPRPAAPAGRARRAPDERGRGRALRRAGDDAARPRGHGCTATSRRSSTPTSTLPDGAAARCRWRRCAASPTTPTRPCGRRRTTPSWPRGRPSASRARRRSTRSRARPTSSTAAGNWDSPLDASLYANSVGRPTFDAMQRRCAASLARLPPLDAQRRPRCTATTAALPWCDLVAPLPARAGSDRRGTKGSTSCATRSVATAARSAASSTGRSTSAGSTPSRATASAAARSACRSSATARWCSSTGRQPRRGPDHGPRARPRLPQHPARRAHAVAARLPMALAETASIFCETLVVEEGLQRLDGADRLALLDVDLQGATQVVVDIHSRFLFETELFARRQRRTLGVSELNEMMLDAQADAYGDGLDQSTAHPYMWAVKPHYYGIALLQLAVHLRAAVRPRAVRPVPATIPSGSGTATTTCCRGPGWTRPRSSAPRSASTSPTRRSGWPASTCSRARIAEYDRARAAAETARREPHSLRRDRAPSSGELLAGRAAVTGSIRCGRACTSSSPSRPS